MSALFMDGFDHYGTGTVSTTNMLAGLYAEMSFGDYTVDVPTWGVAATGTGNLRAAGGGSAGNCRRVLPDTKSTLYWSLRFALDSLPNANNGMSICDLRDTANVVIGSLVVQSTGALCVVNKLFAPLMTSTAPIIVAENWHFLEMFYDHDTAAWTVYVDDASASGTPIIQQTGLAFTGSGGVAQIGLLSSASHGGGFPVSYLDDLFVRDSSGSVNNGFLGDRRVATLLADADTPTAGWTPNYYHQLGAGILTNTATNAGVLSPSSTSLNIGSGDFTIEEFVRFEALPSGSNKMTIFGKWDEAANQRSYQFFLGSVALNGGKLCFQTSTDGTVSTVAQPILYPWTPDLNVWYHMAVVRASGELLLFVNGQQLGLPISDSNTYFAGTAQMGMGAQTTGSSVFTGSSLIGWLDEVRFTVGFARYTSNFTPTTIEFPRGNTDPQWADVALLCGFDSTIQDESSFTRTLTALNGSVQFTTNDGPLVGVFSTVGKAVPDDNTFVSAPFVAASSVLTLTANASNNNTVRVGTKDGTTAATYTFKTALTGSAFEVFIDTNIQNTLQNLFNAINAGPGAGTKYGTGTTANFDVNAVQLPAGQMEVLANLAGTAGNSIVSTSSGITGGWTAGTLAGGLNIPGPSNFRIQRLPPATTIVSAVQISTRAFKSDSGVGTFNTAFVGPLGAVSTGDTHPLTLSPNYTSDIYEIDPDTSGPISPTTITNGSIQINRDT